MELSQSQVDGFETYFHALLARHMVQAGSLLSNSRTSAHTIREHADELRLHVETAQTCFAYRSAEAMTSAWADLQAKAKGRE